MANSIINLIVCWWVGLCSLPVVWHEAAQSWSLQSVWCGYRFYGRVDGDILWEGLCQHAAPHRTAAASASDTIAGHCQPTPPHSHVFGSACPSTIPSYSYFFYFFSCIFISWRLITLQYCSGFCHTLTWISHGFTCIPYPDLPSHIPLHPIPLGLPSAPDLSTCLMHPAWAGDLFHPR